MRPLSFLILAAFLIPLNLAPLWADPQPSAVATPAQALRSRGEALQYKYDYVGAIASYKQAYALDKSVNLSDASLDLYKIAACYYDTSQYPAALTYYQLELGIEQKIGDKKSIPITLNNIGLVFNELSQYSNALDCYRAVLLLQHASGDTVGTAATLSNIGSVYDDLGKREEAMDYFQKALTIQIHLNDKLGQAQTLSNIGEVYDQTARYPKALDAFQQSLMISIKFKDNVGIATELANLGLVYSQGSLYANALQCYKYALPILKKIGDSEGTAITLNNVAGVYDSLGQSSRALDTYLQVLPILKQAGDKSEEANTLVNIGLTYDDLGLYEKALENYQSALVLQQSIGDVVGEATTYTNIGSVYTNLGQYGRAMRYLLLALPLRKQVSDFADEAKTLNNIGAVYQKTAKFDRALQYYEMAIPISREIGDKESEAASLGNIMELASIQGNAGLAIFFGKQAVNVYQSIRGSLSTLDKRSQQSYLKANAATYRSLSDLLIREGRLPEAQQVLGLLKEQEFFDFLRGEVSTTPDQVTLTPTEAVRELDYDAIADQVVALGDTQQAILDRVRLGTATAADQSQLEDARAKLEAATHHMNSFLAQLSHEFSITTPAGEGLQARLQELRSASGLQDTLRQLHLKGQDVVVLETVVAPDRYAVIVTTAQSQKVEQTPISSDALNAKVASFQAALRDPTVDPRPLALDLYKIIFAPIENDLKQAGARTLMWSLDGTLRYVPISALYDGKQYLVERFDNEVFTLGSQSGFGTDESPKWEGLGLGVSLEHNFTDPVTGQVYNFPALHAVPAELNAVIDSQTSKNGIVPGDILLDPQFTWTAMSRALEMQKYNLVHIASHFALHPGDPDGSFLLLGDGAHISLTDMADDQTLFQGVDLLALSACDTATGGVSGDGTEIDSLGTIAQQDGAKSVLASLWPVSDESTRLLMRSFYQEHEAQAGTTKVEALRQAQLSLLYGDASATSGAQRGVGQVNASTKIGLPAFTPNPNAPFSHPFYWAPFILIGNWR